MGMGKKIIGGILICTLGLWPVAGCEQLPGPQGVVIGGAAGAAAGALIAEEDNTIIGALLGGLVGAAAGYLIGSSEENIENDNTQGAIQAVKEAQQDPATVQDVRTSETADLNNDGFVTLDEVVALERAGLSDQQIIQRLEATGQVFDLNQSQKQYLAQHGVSQRVIEAIEQINQDLEQQLLGTEAPEDTVISQ